MSELTDRETKVNELLARERARGSIDVALLSNLLHGEEELEKRRHMYKIVSKEIGEITKNNMSSMDKNTMYYEGIRRHALMTRILQENPQWTSFTDKMDLMRMVFQYTFPPFLLHFTMFRDCLESQGTAEQLQKWIPQVESQVIIGTFAQTEMGHGTNLSCLETTATYDTSTQEFVVNTPTLTATKFWPGGLGKSCNHAAIMAQCIVGGKNRGLHAFLVPLRHAQSHEPLPGVELGDIGPKLGWNSIDNGYLRLHSVRIPRTHMLMKHAEVSREGVYKRNTGNDKSAYLGLIHARSLAGQYLSGRLLLIASTIALRYNIVSTSTITGDERIQMINLKPHLFDISYAIATGFAFWFSGGKLLKDYATIYPVVVAGDFEQLPELHVRSSALKALGSDTAPRMLERLRNVCGFAGDLIPGGLPFFYDLVAAGITIDGENTVLYLQIARFLMKKGNKTRVAKVDYQRSWCDVEVMSNYGDLDFLVRLHHYRKFNELENVLVRFKEKVAQKGLGAAWNAMSIQLVNVAKIHALNYVLDGFREIIQSLTDAILKSVMADLFRLFSYTKILEAKVDFLKNQTIQPHDVDLIEDTVDKLVGKLAPNLTRLVDAFDMSDLELNSVMGGFEGRVVEGLVSWLKMQERTVHAREQVVSQELESLRRSYSKL